MSGLHATRRGFCEAAGAAVVGLSSAELVSPPEPSVEWTASTAEAADLYTVADTAFLAGVDLRALDPSDGSERWRVEGESGLELEAVGDESVFVDSDGGLRAHDAATGEHRWTYGDARSPAYRDGTVFVVADERLRAVGATDGELRWTAAEPELRPLGPPVVTDDTVYPGDTGRFHAVDAATGEVRWTVTTATDEFARPALTRFGPADGPSPTVDGVVPVWDTAGVLLGASVADGSEQWRVERVPASNSPPVARHDDALLGAGEASLTAYSAATGVEQWRVETERGFGYPHAADGTAFLSSGDTVHAVDAATGERRWRTQFDSERPVNVGEVADGVVPVSSWDGWVGALDPADGRLRWRYDHGGEPAWFPATADGTVYLGTRDGRAIALSAPDDPESPLNRLTPTALAGSVGLAGALAAAGYRRLRGDP